MVRCSRNVRWPRRWKQILALAVLSTLVITPAVVNAEALPTRVIVSHVPTLTTWGPPTANGVVMVTLSEGDVRADFAGLASLPNGQRYGLWLLRSKDNQAFWLGSFTQPDGQPLAHVDILLPQPIPDAGWDIVLVTVESSDHPPAPSGQRVLIGAFPGTPPELSMLPPALPKTGMPLSTGTPLGLLATNLALLAALGHIRARSRAARGGRA